MRLVYSLCFALILPSLFAQPTATPNAARMEGYQQRLMLNESSWIREIPFKNVGPRVFSGRVTDIQVNPNRTEEFLVAYASGGLWHTSNNGASLTPLFDQEAAMTIGAIAAHWSTGTLWVGTGEVNASRSSYAGTGIYVSRDTGATWSWSGLPESHHIGRIILHPDNPDIVWVAVLGHLYTPNSERGVFRTTDGGQTWQHVLAIDEHTGAIDLLLDPQSPDILYAAMWQRHRSAWNFEEAGPGSGIYKSSDGGSNWMNISEADQGYPSGEGCGRIGLAAGVRNGQTEVYALVDNYNRRPKEPVEKEKGVLHKEDFRLMDSLAFMKLDTTILEKYLRSNGFPKKYTAPSVKELVRSGKIKPLDLVTYLEDANSLLFDTPVIGAEIYRLQPNGLSWQKTHADYLDDLYFSYGYYFGQIRVEKDNPDHMYVMGVPILRSYDGGKSFVSINGKNVHVDHHALWINPNNPGHLLLGNDGGLNLSYDFGDTWTRLNRVPVGQFYAVAVDNAAPFNIYGGLQDNGVWKGPSNYTADDAWEMEGRYPFVSLIGGDGMQIQVDPRDNHRLVYTGYQFGNYFRIDTQTEDRHYITPKPNLGERPYRWNWQTPIHLSVHHPDILYMGSERVLRSMDQGNNFLAISEDLTWGGKPGDVPFGTLTSLHESPLRFGLLYAGSDDGLVHVTKDGGVTWQRIIDGLPEGLWVSRIQASLHQESRVWLTLNGYRNDHFTAWVFRSEDYGHTWERIGMHLPAEPANVIREDPVNSNLIYLGTDNGVYASLDRGITFMPFSKNLPKVAVHDLVIHPREGKLILGTHGRSLYMADINHLQSLTPELIAKSGHIYPLADQRYQKNPVSSWSKWLPAKEPLMDIWFYANQTVSAQWQIKPENHQIVLASGTELLSRGLNTWTFDKVITSTSAMKKWQEKEEKNAQFIPPIAADNGKFYLPPATYLFEVIYPDGQTFIEKLRVLNPKK